MVLSEILSERRVDAECGFKNFDDVICPHSVRRFDVLRVVVRLLCEGLPAVLRVPKELDERRILERQFLFERERHQRSTSLTVTRIPDEPRSATCRRKAPKVGQKRASQLL